MLIPAMAVEVEGVAADGTDVVGIMAIAGEIGVVVDMSSLDIPQLLQDLASISGLYGSSCKNRDDGTEVSKISTIFLGYSLRSSVPVHSLSTSLFRKNGLQFSHSMSGDSLC